MRSGITQATEWCVRRALPALLCAALFLPPAGQADEETTWYQVEMIVFTQADPATVDAEAWPEDPGIPDFTVAISLEDAEAASSPEMEMATSLGVDAATAPDAEPSEPTLRPVNPEEYMLLAQEKRLRKSRLYNPLVHMAWIQPGLEQSRAPVIRVSTAKATEESLFDPREPVLEGTVSLSLGRYLHLRADLLYHQPGMTGPPAPLLDLAADPVDAEPAPWAFRMQQHRRMRSKELHYLDHPVLGILVEVTPLEEEET